MAMRLWFFGSGAIAVPTLQALARLHTVLGVVTQPDRPQGRGQRPTSTPIKETAQALHLSLLDPPSARDPGLHEQIRRTKPDLIAVMAYGGLLPPELLALPASGAVNVHPSLLPRYRGAAPIPWAIVHGDRETGITIFQMDAQLDHGPIILQERIPLAPEETTATLTDRVARLTPSVLTQALAILARGRAPLTPQNEGQATTAPRFTKADGWIDWTLPAAAIARRVRALNPWPGTMTSWRGHALKLLRAATTPADPPTPGTPAGVVIGVEATGIVVRTGEGALIIQDLQLAGGRPLDAAAFVRGHPMRTGDPLGSR